MEIGPWNWLEVAKLGAGLLLPAALAVFGIFIHHVTKRFEHAQWRSQKLIEKRLAVYDELTPKLNDLLCYFTYVGCWRDLDPPEVVALKRSIDKILYVGAPLFTEEFFNSCTDFQNLCFEHFVGWGLDARLRTKFQRRQEALANDWDLNWNIFFSDNTTAPNEVRDAYWRVMKALAKDIGVHEGFVVPPLGHISTNIK